MTSLANDRDFASAPSFPQEGFGREGGARIAGPGGPIARGAARAAYSAAQLARIAWFTGHYMVGRRKMGPLTNPGDAPYAEQSEPLDRERLKASFREVFDKEWAAIAAGQYRMPYELRRAPSLPKLLQTSRDYLRDAEAVARRKAENRHAEVLDETARRTYPRYYLQNFHFQTDGWLSEESADRYEMQVETLFTGAAAPMRRQALPFIGAVARQRKDARLVDLGCGAGVFLRDVLDNWPDLDVTAVDLSPAYLAKARTCLAAFPSVKFREGRAEETQLQDAAADLVTAVYLFHELPPKIRAQVVKEAARLLAPGGRFVLVDTIQYGDEPGLDILLENFPRGFHEPYYDGYCREDLAALAAGAGLEKTAETHSFLTKVTVFEKQDQ